MKTRTLPTFAVLAVLICVLFSAAHVLAARKTAGLEDHARTLGFSKAVPSQLNYQGYLVDAADSSAVTDTLEMTFRLYDAATAGTEQWAETQALVPVIDGLFSTLLGSVTPFPGGLFDGSLLWLQTEVGGEVLAPRKPLVSVAYSHRAEQADHATTADLATEATDAQHAVLADTAAFSQMAAVTTADSAVVADNTHQLGGESLTDLDDRWVNEGQAGSVTSAMITDSTIARLDVAADFKAPFADTADFAHTATGAVPAVPLILTGSSADPILQIANEGTGHGVTVDSAQGCGVYVDSAGTDGVHVHRAGLASGVTTSSDANGLEVAGAQGNGLYIGQADKRGVYVYNADSDGIYVRRAGASTGSMVSSGSNNAFEVMATEGYGIYVGNANASGMRVYKAGEPSAGANGPNHNGFEVRGAEGCGLFVGHADSAGVFVNSTGDHGFVVLEPEESGLYVSIAGEFGVHVDSSSDDGIRIENTGDDGVHIISTIDDGVVVASAGGRGIYVLNAGDDGGYFDIGSGSTGWAIYAHSLGTAGNGMYCYGNGTITGAWSKTVPTSKGWETVQTLSAPDEEIVASGMARLVNGKCRVEFERLFSEAISPKIPVKVVLTPMDQWSGLYTADRSYTGFTVLSGAGAQDVQFTWQAIGRRQGYEQRPVVTIPDPQEEKALLEAEAREMELEEQATGHERLRPKMEEQTLLQRDGEMLIDPAPNGR